MDTFVMCWFGASVLIEVVGNAAFVLWLRANGARMTFARAGMPWYTNGVYVDWCRSQGRPPGRILLLRRISLVNTMAAVVVALPFLARER